MAVSSAASFNLASASFVFMAANFCFAFAAFAAFLVSSLILSRSAFSFIARFRSTSAAASSFRCLSCSAFLLAFFNAACSFLKLSISALVSWVALLFAFSFAFSSFFRTLSASSAFCCRSSAASANVSSCISSSTRLSLSSAFFFAARVSAFLDFATRALFSSSASALMISSSLMQAIHFRSDFFFNCPEEYAADGLSLPQPEHK